MNNQIRIESKYDPEKKTVHIIIGGLAQFSIPYDIFKNIYYSAHQQHEKAALMVPNKNLVDIKGKPIKSN